MSDEKQFTIERYGREFVFKPGESNFYPKVWSCELSPNLTIVIACFREIYHAQIIQWLTTVSVSAGTPQSAAIAAIDALVKLVTDTGLFEIKNNAAEAEGE